MQVTPVIKIAYLRL